MFKKIAKLISQHKRISGIVLIILIASAYFGIKAIKSGSQGTSYVLAAVEKGTLIVSVSGSGQVTVLDQVDVKPET